MTFFRMEPHVHETHRRLSLSDDISQKDRERQLDLYSFSKLVAEIEAGNEVVFDVKEVNTDVEFKPLVPWASRAIVVTDTCPPEIAQIVEEHCNRFELRTRDRSFYGYVPKAHYDAFDDQKSFFRGMDRNSIITASRMVIDTSKIGDAPIFTLVGGLFLQSTLLVNYDFFLKYQWHHCLGWIFFPVRESAHYKS